MSLRAADSLMRYADEALVCCAGRFSLRLALPLGLRREGENQKLRYRAQPSAARVTTANPLLCTTLSARRFQSFIRQAACDMLFWC